MKTDTIVRDSNVIVYDSVSKIECYQRGLSKEFDINVFFVRFSDVKEYHDSCIVKLQIVDKATHYKLDSLSITSRLYYEDVFKDCKNVLSYSTGININKKILDNYYGDIIVADLNFDDRDDIVVINDSGGNSGTFYNFYLQDKNKKFTLNRYLTDSMVYFPQKINKRNRTLVTYALAGACGVGEHVHQLNPVIGEWKEKSHRIIGECK
ncbi:MAG TPA: hypothetical protein VL443_02045 [Cyclobacteriaceae bacterium]|nr:hypothetical protein [Cyclobacteriaceae bacterium]